METKEFLAVVGKRIRSYRKAWKISQEKLSEMSDIHPSYISEIELGKTNASIYSYYKIANALGMSLSELVSLPHGEENAKLESLLSGFKKLSKRKQGMFLSAAGCFLEGIKGSK